MIIKSEIIQSNLEVLEKAKKEFSLLQDYANTDDDSKLKIIWEEARSYNMLSYLNFIDFIKFTNKTNQQVFYKNKIKIPHFKEVLVFNATDLTVKKILQSKGKVSFAKLINSPKWDLYSGNRRRRGGVRYHDNFTISAAIIANFCIQNEIEISEKTRISDYYTQRITEIDSTIKKELDLTKNLIEYLVKSVSDSPYDFKRLNIEHINKCISNELKSKLLNIESGESVRVIETTDYYGGLTYNKTYKVLDKELQSGRLQIIIDNDKGMRRSYPYRLFETIHNLRDNSISRLLEDL